MLPEELTIETPALRLAACAWGPPDGKRLLALHGWLDNAASYAPLAPLLPGLRLVALDLPGHGRSEARPVGSAYHFIDWLPNIFEAADALGWDRFVLMGHSMGAGICSLAAGVFPERVEKLILLEGIGPMVDAEEDVPQKVAEYIVQRRLRIRRAPLPHESREVAAVRLAKVVPNLSLASARLLVVRGTRDVDGGVTWVSDSRLRQTSPMRFTEGQVRAFLRRIIAPTLVLSAEEGLPFPGDLARERMAEIPNMREQKLSGGHHFHMETPEPVAVMIREFLGDR